MGRGARGQSLPENEELYEGISCAVLRKIGACTIFIAVG
jgi:hypothetical protein